MPLPVQLRSSQGFRPGALQELPTDLRCSCSIAPVAVSSCPRPAGPLSSCHSDEQKFKGVSNRVLHRRAREDGMSSPVGHV